MASEKLNSLFEEDFQWELLDNPEFASQAGQHDFLLTSTNKLQDVSPIGYLKRIDHSKRMANTVIQIENEFEGQWSKDEKYLIKVFEKSHKDLYEASELTKMYLLPINGIGAGCVTFSFLESIEWMRFELDADFTLYLERLIAFPTQVNQFIESFREGIRLNFIASLPMTRGVIDQLETIIKGEFPEIYAPLKEPFQSNRFEISKVNEFEEAIKNIRASLMTFLNFFRDEYIPKARNSAGCDTLPNGKEIYDTCLR